MKTIPIDEVVQRLNLDGFEASMVNGDNISILWDEMYSASMLRLISIVLSSGYDFTIIWISDCIEINLIPLCHE